MKNPIYPFYKSLADSDANTIRHTRAEFEDILGMKVDDETYISLYINARYLPGYRTFPITKLIPLFLRSKFRLPKAANFLYKKFSRKIVNNDSCQDIVNKISEQGYYVVENFLKPEEIDRIKDELTRFDYVAGVYDTTHKLAELRKNNKIVDKDAPSMFLTHCAGSEIDVNSQIGRMMIDPYMADICASYFQCQPYFSKVSSIFTTARDPKMFSSTHVHGSAQTWHFDYSDFKFLKFFIYLTDVSPENGPHTFAAGTHEENLIYPTTADGFYEGGFKKLTTGEMEGRVKEEWVRKNVPAERIKEFACPKGTLIIENTSGLHKGGNCTSGQREVLIFDYAISNMTGSQMPYIDYNPAFPYDSHLMTALKSLRQDQIDKEEAFKRKYTINQRIRGKIITTFKLKGLTID